MQIYIKQITKNKNNKKIGGNNMYNKKERISIIAFLIHPTAELCVEIRKKSEDLTRSTFLIYQGLREHDPSLIEKFFTDEESKLLALEEDQLNKKIKFELSKDGIEILMLADLLVIDKEDNLDKPAEYWAEIFEIWKTIHDTTIGKSTRLAGKVMNAIAQTWEQYSDCLERAWESLSYEEQKRILLQKMEEIADTDERKALIKEYKNCW